LYSRQRRAKREAPERRRAKPAPRRLVLPHALEVEVRRLADPLLQGIEQRVKLMAARRPVPGRHIDIVLATEADRKLALLDLDRDQNAEIVCKIDLFDDPPRGDRL